jgi:hypothetical protein
VVGTNVLEGPEQPCCLRGKRVTQHMGEPQLQQISCVMITQAVRLR